MTNAPLAYFEPDSSLGDMYVANFASLRVRRPGGTITAEAAQRARAHYPVAMTETTARTRNPMAFLDAEIEELKAKGLYRRLRVVESEQKSR